MKKKEYQKSSYKKPGFFAFEIYRMMCIYVSKIVLNGHVVRNEFKGVKEPCVVLMNHESGLDHCCMGLLTKRRITYVIAESRYYTTKFFWLFKQLHTVNKKQFRTDLNDIKNMKAVIDGGGCLIIFPAGVCTACGMHTELPAATGKFLKLLGADVYVAKISGVYLSNPKWSDIKRRGGVDVDAYRLISAEALKSGTYDEIYQLADEALKYNDYEWQEKKMVKFKNGNNIVGLENVLYSCPVCGGFKSILHKGKDTIYCEKCGFEEKADEYGFLHKVSSNGVEIRYPSEWFRAINRDLKNTISQDDSFRYEFSGKIFTLSIKRHKFVFVANGRVVVDKEKIVVITECEEKLLDETTKSYLSIPSIPGKYLDLQHVDGIYRVYPDDGKDVSVFLDTVKAINDIKNNKQFDENTRKRDK